MSRQAKPRTEAALLRAQRKRRRRASGTTLLQQYAAAMPRRPHEWLALLVCAAFTALCLLPVGQALAWLGRMVAW